jgi:hypothetical protein
MIDMNDVKQLLTRADEHTLTLYLNVDNATPENQAVVPAWQTWLQNELGALEGRLDKEQKAALPFIRDWLNTFTKDFQPSSKGLVIIAGSSFQNTYELPLAFQNQAFFGKPQVLPLLWTIDEYEPYLVVMVDQEKAKFFVSYLGEMGFQEGVNLDVDEYDFAEKTIMSNPGPGIDNGAVHGGTGQDDFRDTLDEHRARFYRDAITHIERLMQKHNAERIVLAGNERAAHAVQNEMSDKLKAAVIGIVNIPMYATMAQILEQALPAALEFERKQELELVSQVIDFAKSRGRGALGYEAVNEALDMQRVELLVLLWPSPNEEQSNDLAFRALQLNSNIELVHGEAANRLQSEGGVAARLYYAL